MKRLLALAIAASLALLPAASAQTNRPYNAPTGNVAASKITGTVGVANGGTGAATITGIPLGTGTAAFTALAYTDWTTPAFNAGDYTSDTGTFVVAAGDVGTFAYTIVGKTMTVAFNINTATTTGTPALLRILIPGSKTATKQMRNLVNILDNGTRSTASVTVAASGTVLEFQRLDAAAWANSTDNTYLLGQITFQIN